MFKKVSGVFLSLSLALVFTVSSQALAAEKDVTEVKYYTGHVDCPNTLSYNKGGYKGTLKWFKTVWLNKLNTTQCHFSGTVKN
ncbi:hypothetical protein [Paenibacillus oleatilyticus]|uniref:hypothetical protein n=1 Tax=Paenibacillus oleatilyticus TaxID=2594886 RepID=UPI001C1FAC99|nr:hypothetical protein [Paenibacillus oleatilyticus]MBU7319162.1 hypothetical protein [Paenibacillus oleatilyticus]